MEGMPEPKEIVICGLDGVIALLEHRLHHLYNDDGVKDWDRFLEACTDDMPNLPLIDRLNQARGEGVPVMIVTGRSSAVREQTIEWLRQWHIGYDGLVMRPAGDFTSAGKFKAAVIERSFTGATIRRVYESTRQLEVARWCAQQDIPCTLIGPNQGNGESREVFELKVVNHACGHIALHPFYGDDDVAWDERVHQLADTPCRLCQAEEMAKERKQKADEARLAAREQGLPPLEGSEKQVEWAEGIRIKAFSAVNKVLKWTDQVSAEAEAEDPDHWSTVTQGIKRAIAYLEEQVDAKWWIDHRHGIMNNLDGGRALLSAVAEQEGYF
ncbi:hypothetical protein SAMN03097708_02567 [Thiohalomonas denitrificans]|uniref:Polynucleotide kinase PNKP phosphatase domain-containing protein n=2 Tax=Thiohalomonas denitrificans TaxID=415747 RepID=A0A1G5QSP5_9GAMM|nr:hypothetical protein SAMN03097708_02567 [Thiohalomonas denitrificans]